MDIEELKEKYVGQRVDISEMERVFPDSFLLFTEIHEEKGILSGVFPDRRQLKEFAVEFLDESSSDFLTTCGINQLNLQSGRGQWRYVRDES